MKISLEYHLLTAGGKILCRRCRAVSGCTKQQCGRPALKEKNVCQFHGGRSTGPKSEHSKERLRTLNLKRGDYTKEKRLASEKQALTLRYLEDIGIHIGLFPSKTRGRKPRGYQKLNPNVREEYFRMFQLAGILES